MKLFRARDLYVFIWVYELRSFLRASQTAGMAQSAVSKRMARLEGEVGQKLFVRLQHGVRPTEAGDTLYRYAQRFMALQAETRGAFAQEKRSA